MTGEFFVDQMQRMAGMRYAPTNFNAHFEALHTLEEHVLEAAVLRAITSLEEFPSAKQLLVFADVVRPSLVPIPALDLTRETPLPQPVTFATSADSPVQGSVTVRRLWRYYCQDCNDSGWQAIWCRGNVDAPQSVLDTRKPWHDVAQQCDRSKEHYAHEWSRKCHCVDHNPAVLRRKEQARQGGRRGEDH